MAVGETFCYLMDEELGLNLIELFSSAHEAQQITSSTQLHHEAEVRFSFK